ncbi:hypothetical protein [Fusobacterium gastrosuis]|uniref:hypothetical protein n=1 Tax=Fusobacterium gastrosuis TaxID=1755100 RepID=UPI002979714C|nr:hypothetical protein [Fusobacteriaceae bacterium]MDY5713626.1 hypothetical protein [Fusobacterium gastrosuis]
MPKLIYSKIIECKSSNITIPNIQEFKYLFITFSDRDYLKPHTEFACSASTIIPIIASDYTKCRTHIKMIGSDSVDIAILNPTTIYAASSSGVWITSIYGLY